jgi:WD40 repeat protein
MLLGLLVVLPASAAETAVEVLPDRVGVDDVSVVLGEDDRGVWFLTGEVSRRSGMPVLGMTLQRLSAEGGRHSVPTGAELLAADLSSRGELALVTLDGTVLVGHGAPFDALDLGDLYVTQARWDPDGERLAVTAWSDGTRPWDASRAATVADLRRAIDNDIYLVELDGAVRRVSYGPKQDYNPVWSPDGEQLLFVSLRTGYASLFLTDTTGSTVSQLTNLGAERGAPAVPVPLSDRCWWIGEHILYETAPTARGSEVWWMRVGGSASRIVDGAAVGAVGTTGLLRTSEGWQILDLSSVTEGRLP